jgi:hypothetical protein
LVEPLSQRELNVPALLADGASNREIAEKPVNAIGTVKPCAIRVDGQSPSEASEKLNLRQRAKWMLAREHNYQNSTKVRIDSREIRVYIDVTDTMLPIPCYRYRN